MQSEALNARLTGRVSGTAMSVVPPVLNPWGHFSQSEIPRRHQFLPFRLCEGHEIRRETPFPIDHDARQIPSPANNLESNVFASLLPIIDIPPVINSSLLSATLSLTHLPNLSKINVIQRYNSCLGIFNSSSKARRKSKREERLD